MCLAQGACCLEAMSRWHQRHSAAAARCVATCQSQGVSLIQLSCIHRCCGADLLQQARHEEIALCHAAGAATEPGPVVPLGRPHLQAGIRHGKGSLRCREDMDTKSSTYKTTSQEQA